MPLPELPNTLHGVLADMLKQARSEPGGSLWFLPFILKTDVDALFERLNRGRFKAEHSAFGDFYVVRIWNYPRPGEDDEDEERVVAGDFLLFRVSEKVWCFSSSERAKVFHRCALAAVQGNSRIASQIYIPNREYSNIFDQVAGKGLNIKVLQHSEYNRQESTVTSLKKKRDYKSVFAEIRAKNSAIRRVRASAQKEDENPVVLFSLWNNGMLALRNGSVAFFNDIILADIGKIGIIRNALFSNKQRTKLNLHPLRLAFDEEVLAYKSQNADFIKALTSLEQSAVAVFHANPYLHCLYTDFRDDSSFNIFASSPVTVDVVPSIRASVSALTKLYRGISEKFADCEISEIQDTPPSIDEFFGAQAPGSVRA
jgi:hypothetical protein